MSLQASAGGSGDVGRKSGSTPWTCSKLDACRLEYIRVEGLVLRVWGTAVGSSVFKRASCSFIGVKRNR